MYEMLHGNDVVPMERDQHNIIARSPSVRCGE
jgi:hypothetical protein